MAPSTGTAVSGRASSARFYSALAVVTALGLAFRVGYVLLFTTHENAKFYDAFWYAVTGDDLAHGIFFRTISGTAPSAAHPPLTPVLLSVPYYFFGGHPDAAQVGMAVIGAAVVLCVGLLGRAVAGPGVGIVAAVLAAFAPNFWIPSGILMADTPTMLMMALILLATVHTLRSPRALPVVLLGAACAGAALARAELILFLPTLLVPAVLAARSLSVRRRLGLIVLGLVAAGVVSGPWMVRNFVVFHKPTYVSTGIGGTLLGSNCPSAYYGSGMGGWHIDCLPTVRTGDESDASAHDQHAAVTYAKKHAGRLPVVVLARIGRLWDAYKPLQMVQVDVNEGRPAPAATAGLIVYYVLAPFAVAGIVLLRRRGVRQWFLLVPAGVLTLVSALFYGTVRFRSAFEVCFVVLAAVPMVAAVEWLGRRRRGAGAPSPRASTEEPLAAGVRLARRPSSGPLRASRTAPSAACSARGGCRGPRWRDGPASSGSCRR